MRQFFSIFTTTLLILALLLAGTLVGVRLFGLAPYTVLSGSMEPTYHVGSLIYVKKVDAADLKAGDPITYVIDGGTVVTHRIVRVIENEENPTDRRFKTKGDNNNIEDGEPVRAENILGKPVFTIPLLGYIAYFVQTPPTSYLAIGMCVIIVLMTFLPDLLDKLDTPAPQKGEAPAKKQDEGETPPDTPVE